VLLFLLALVVLALGGVAVIGLVRSITLPRTRVSARLDELGAYGYTVASPSLAGGDEGGEELLTGVARRLGDFLAGRFGGVGEDGLRRLLIGAGMYGTSARTLLGYRVLGALAMGGLGLLAGHTPLARVALAAFLGFCGWTFTVAYVRRRAATRALAIEREIPNLIDQIVVTLEAGVGFAASLQISATRLSGPLGDEMRLTLQEQRMGNSMTEALKHMRERVESPNLKSFVRAVVQGERLGVSIGSVMRDLAIDMRKRRRQMAEEQAAKAPVKLLIPLVFLILPTLFVVLLAPPILDLVHGIGGG
jgi:tight adherence protein C